MKVLLIFPPEWLPYQPYLSTPCLTAALKKEGIAVSQRDLNIEAWDTLLSKDELGRADKLAGKRFKKLIKGSHEYEALLSFVVAAPSIIEEIETTKKILRSEEFYNTEKYIRAYNRIRLARLLIAGAYNIAELLCLLKEERFSAGSTQELFQSIEGKKENTFLQFLHEYALRSILKEEPDVVGISIIDATQVIPGLTLARLIKENRPETHVVVGGNVFTRLADVLVKNPQFFSYFDSVVIYEGEQALVELVRRLSDKKSLDGVPNLVYYDGSKVVLPDRIVVEDMNNLTTPDFDGLPSDLYFAPEPILPILSSRGCYWRRCAFCDHGYGYSKGYRPRDINLLIEDFVTLQQKYNAKNFFFVDETMSPKMCDELSSAILKENIQVNWVTDARLEQSFTADLLSKMARSGCKVLYWGLESGCQRVLNLMDKGIDLNNVRRICQDASRAGIWNHLFLFFGFPGETKDEAQQTIDFILDNKELVNSIGAGTFVLGKYSKVAISPESYGVQIIMDEKKDLSLLWDYQPLSGINSKEAEQFEKLALRSVIDGYSGHIFYGAIPREHVFVYLSRFSKKELARMAEPLRKQVVESYYAAEKRSFHL